MKKQAGFTLIELIMVIVILGVLSAFALPRFADLGGQARAASINGAAGAIRSAANIAHAQWLAEGGLATDTDVDLEGTTINLIHGYPQALAATNDGIFGAAQITATDYTVVGSGGAAASASIVIQVPGATTATACQVTYTAPSAAGAAPTIAVVNTGC